MSDTPTTLTRTMHTPLWFGLQVKDHRATSGFRSTNRMVYEFNTDPTSGFEFPYLLPRSYAGMLGWLEGRRHWRQARGLPLE